MRDFWYARAPWQKWLIGIVAAIILWPFLMTFVYAVVPPPFSNVMLERLPSGNGLQKQWMPLDRMSPWLVKAVVSSEDQRFCSHHGVDWVEFQDAIGNSVGAGEAPSRGASTISMQTAKNLFLWDGHSVIRKVIELPLSYYMDFIWTKHRMLEVYLNIAEWAPGVYGAEAAAQHHFGKSASQLTKREAALLAAVLPNPIKRQAGKPSRGVNLVAARIQFRMAAINPYLTCIH
jgi:monofunctional biosynthetic peptidoglycan transglycosylase